MATKTGKGSTAELGPAHDCEAITPHASNTITATKGIMVTGAGTVACRFVDADADTTLTLLAGTYYPFSVVAVRTTGTAATGIFGFY
jgi:hypothetical protein